MNDSVPGVDYTPPPEHPHVYTPMSREQLDMVQDVLINEDDTLHASVLLVAASYPEVVFHRKTTPTLILQASRRSAPFDGLPMSTLMPPYVG